jgi:hypothetical protein
MPTEREREYYRMGFKDGKIFGEEYSDYPAEEGISRFVRDTSRRKTADRRKPKRKLSAWNKYVKANSKKPRFRYRNGKLNLKKMAIAFRKTPAGKKKRR